MTLQMYKKIRPAKVVITMSGGQVVEGTINIGFEHRVSDFLSLLDKAFIPVFDINGSNTVILLNKNQIASVQPVAENLETPDPDREPEGIAAEDRTGDVHDKGVPVL